MKPDERSMENLEKLNSDYVRAWGQEWAMTADAVERMFEYYARVEDEREVIAYMCAMANAQRFRLLRSGRLITLDQFLRDQSVLPMETEPDWNTEINSLSKRFF